uniref:hypothetical protein n=1 Tax=Escherichia coli TaxID=562 RepID=UPI00203646CB|nr:hypothetical protein [Escherichia coli]
MISAGDFKGKKSPVNGLIYQAIIKGTDHISTLPWLGFDVDRERASTSAVFIHALRGLPDDIPSEDDDLFGEHSYSWLTSEEILSAIPPDNAGEVIQNLSKK